MFSAWWTKCGNFLCSVLWLFYHFSFFLFSFLFFLISTGKRYPFTSLVPNTQNYVTGTMKFQHVLLTFSDLWALPPRAASTCLFVHFLFFSNLIANLYKICLMRKKKNLFYTSLTISWFLTIRRMKTLDGSSQMLNLESILRD